MPRVCLTAAQKEAAAIQARHKRLTDGIKVHKVLHDLTWAQEAERLGVDVRTLRKLLKGEPCRVSMLSMWRLLDAAGLTPGKEEKV